MPSSRMARFSAVLLLIVAGCRSAGRPTETVRLPGPAPAVGSAAASGAQSPAAAPAVEQVVHQQSSDVDAGSDPFAGQAELSLAQLVAEVVQRNPTLQASLAAWSAAAERYPQAVALDDPLFQSMLAPASIGSSSVQSSFFVGVAQKLPWPGKRGLRGQAAQWEADAASFDSQEVQLRLREAAQIAFFDYYLVRRELALNDANVEALRKFRDTANAKYQASKVTQQDVLQAEVELARLDSRRIELEQNERVAVARINTLLHRGPDRRLPPPPASLSVGTDRWTSAELQATAAQRPELAAQAARIQAEQTALALACKEFYPDVELMGRYDQFWTDSPQRGQIGLNVNIPLDQSRRRAAVREAMFRLRKMEAEYQQALDNVRHDVETACARVEGSRKTAWLYSQRILPAARRNVESAAAGYTAGNVDFLRLIQAEREAIELEEKYQDAVAEYHRRRAELERAVGGELPAPP